MLDRGQADPQAGRDSGVYLHHSEDAPWVAVLESLFEAGFYLEATYPIRSDETKGTGQFGSRKIEYDIIHVCRKRHEEPKPISWAKLRRQVLEDVRELTELLEHHQEEGLPEADLQVIRRGKALEYFSRHYGKVFKDQDVPMSVAEALLGVNQVLDEEAAGVKEPPPHNAEPFTRDAVCGCSTAGRSCPATRWGSSSRHRQRSVGFRK